MFRPTVVTSPSAVTTLRLRTKSLVTPYFTQHIPPALVATFPPIVEIATEPGSGGYDRLNSAKCFFRSRLITPGSTVTVPSSVFTSRIRFILATLNRMHPSSALIPPESPVRAPEGMMGIACLAANRTVARTSSTHVARTNASAFPTGENSARSLE